MKTNNPFFDNLIETQTKAMNEWMDTAKKFQSAATSGSIATEGQNIYKEWFDKQMNLLGGMQAGMPNMFGANNKPEEFFKNWYNQQLESVKKMTDFNQSLYNSFANYGKPATDYMNNFATMNSTWTNMYNSWINTLNNTYDVYTKNLNSSFNKDMFKNMFESNQVFLKVQEAFQPMMKAIQNQDFTAETWKNIYNTENYKKVAEQLFGSFYSGANMKEVYDNATKQVHEFFVNQNNLSKEYFQQLQGMNAEFPQLFSGNFEQLKALYGQVNNVFGKTFEPIMKLANPGKEKENVEAAIALMDKVAEYSIKQNELQYNLMTTTQKAFETIAKEYSEKYKNVNPGEMPNMNEVYNEWIKTSEKFLGELLATEEFSKIKAETISLGMDVKKQFEKQFEGMFENYPIVFRSEVDELYKTIHDLKKTVKELQNKLALNGSAVELFEEEKAAKAKKK